MQEFSGLDFPFPPLLALAAGVLWFLPTRRAFLLWTICFLAWEGLLLRSSIQGVLAAAPQGEVGSHLMTHFIQRHALNFGIEFLTMGLIYLVRARSMRPRYEHPRRPSPASLERAA